MTIIKKSSKTGKVKIDLTGPDGNAYALMAYANRFCKQLRKDHKPLIEEMMSGDYENLVAIMEREFGDYIIMYR